MEGIKQINSTFDKVQNIEIGMPKPDSDGKVVAKRVYNIKPMFKGM